MVVKWNPTGIQVSMATRHVLYEMETFVLATNESLQKSEVTRFLLESRLLHTRNLIGFFSDKRGTLRNAEQHDVVARDYGFPPHPIDLGSNYDKNLDKFLAHITYDRTEEIIPGETQWPLKNTVVPLLAPCKEFAQYLLSNCLALDDQDNRKVAARLIEDIDELEKNICKMQGEPQHAISTQGTSTATYTHIP